MKRTEYDTSVVALLILADDIVGFCNIVMGTLSVAAPPAFEALTVIVNLPALDGLPDRSPDVLMLIPEGCPETLHTIGSVPCEAVN